MVITMNRKKWNYLTDALSAIVLVVNYAMFILGIVSYEHVAAFSLMIIALYAISISMEMKYE